MHGFSLQRDSIWINHYRVLFNVNLSGRFIVFLTILQVSKMVDFYIFKILWFLFKSFLRYNLRITENAEILFIPWICVIFSQKFRHLVIFILFSAGSDQWKMLIKKASNLNLSITVASGLLLCFWLINHYGLIPINIVPYIF